MHHKGIRLRSELFGVRLQLSCRVGVATDTELVYYRILMPKLLSAAAEHAVAADARRATQSVLF